MFSLPLPEHPTDRLPLSLLSAHAPRRNYKIHLWVFLIVLVTRQQMFSGAIRPHRPAPSVTFSGGFDCSVPSLFPSGCAGHTALSQTWLTAL